MISRMGHDLNTTPPLQGILNTTMKRKTLFQLKWKTLSRCTQETVRVNSNASNHGGRLFPNMESQ